MKSNQKKEYIIGHLNEIDENLVNEIYEKIYSLVEEKNPVAGYDINGNPIKKSELLADLKQANTEIEKGDYISLSDLDKESRKW